MLRDSIAGVLAVCIFSFAAVALGEAQTTLTVNNASGSGDIADFVIGGGTPTVKASIDSSGNLVLAGTLQYSGTAAPVGCTSSCNFVLGASVIPPLSVGLSGGHVVNAANTIYIVAFYNDVTRKVGNGYMYVGTQQTGSTVSEALYDSTGARKWTTGGVSAATTGIKSFTPTAYTMVPGTYYLAYCSSSIVPILTATVDISGAANNASNFMGASGTVAHTWGTDTTDTCSTGVLPASITPANITNSATNIQIAAVMITN